MTTRTELTRNKAYRAYRFSPAYRDDMNAHAIEVIETDGVHALAIEVRLTNVVDWWEGTAAFESHLNDIANGDRVLP